MNLDTLEKQSRRRSSSYPMDKAQTQTLSRFSSSNEELFHSGRLKRSLRHFSPIKQRHRPLDSTFEVIYNDNSKNPDFVNFIDEQERTSLIQAIRQCNIMMTKNLLKIIDAQENLELNINHRDIHGHTALDYSIQGYEEYLEDKYTSSKFLEIILLLIENNHINLQELLKLATKSDILKHAQGIPGRYIIN